MSDKTHCGHDPRYIVQADEGTAYCALCELEATRQELAAARAEQRRDAVDGQCALDEANGEIERLRAELAASLPSHPPAAPLTASEALYGFAALLADAVAWFKQRHPDEFLRGADMRVFDQPPAPATPPGGEE